jgi:predicted MFS family arabinose efflux permease
MQPFRAIVSRRFSWRLMIVGACLGLVIGPLVIGWREYPWAAVPLVAASIIVLHPVMDQDLPSLIGLDMLKSPRTYIAIALNIAAMFVWLPYITALQDRVLNGRPPF